ncbi:GIY-YIG nuclease family protein [Planctomycetota bacterium]
MLKCSDHTLYTGFTVDLKKRLQEHQEGAYPGYTKNRRPVRLVFSRGFETEDEAFCFEQQVKGWSRKKKEALIRGDLKAVSYHAKKKFVK